jgi:hypothetical protein
MSAGFQSVGKSLQLSSGFSGSLQKKALLLRWQIARPDPQSGLTGGAKGRTRDRVAGPRAHSCSIHALSPEEKSRMFVG